MNPSTTTNKIHFEDLAPLRFEDLAVNLLTREINHTKMFHYGSLGNDGGVDIELIEKLIGEREQRVYVQCKRYKRFSTKDAEKAISSILEASTLPDKLIFIVTCSISKQTTDFIKKSCENLSISWDLWAASKLESLLYFKHQDLLKTYFGVDVKTEEDNIISAIERRKSMRNTFINELMKDFNPREPILGAHRFENRKFIIQTPEFKYDLPNEPNEHGWYPYFGVRPYSINDEGIQVDFYWGNNLYHRGTILYDDICSYDFESDSGRPIFYCRYKGENGPFSAITWIDNENL